MKRHYLKYAFMTAGLMGAVILPSSLRAQDPATPPPPPPKEGPGAKGDRPELTPEQREERRQKRQEMVAEKLGLSDSQKEQWKKLEEAQHEKMKALKDDTSLSEADKKAKVEEIMKEGKEKRDAILTDDQKAKLEELKKEMGGRGGPGGPGGPGGGGKHHGPKDGGDQPAPAVPAPTAPQSTN